MGHLVRQLRKSPDSSPEHFPHQEQPRGSCTERIPPSCEPWHSIGGRHPTLPRGDASPRPASFPRTAGGLAASLGCYQAASTERFRGGYGRLQRYTRTGNAALGRGLGSEANCSGLLGSGFQVCCSAVCCFSRDMLQPAEASRLLQEVWSALG